MITIFMSIAGLLLSSEPAGAEWSTNFSTGTNSTVWALAYDGSGNLYAGGNFTTADGMSANRVAKWDGSSWSPLGSGVNGTVYTLDIGSLYVGGVSTTAGGNSSQNIAMWSDPLLIELASFTSVSGFEGVTLTWETASETDSAGFRIWRSESKDGSTA